MTGNEIILNLENVENLSNGELVSGLIELGRQEGSNKFNWNNHPTTAVALKDLNKRIPSMNSKNVL